MVTKLYSSTKLPKESNPPVDCGIMDSKVPFVLFGVPFVNPFQSIHNIKSLRLVGKLGTPLVWKPNQFVAPLETIYASMSVLGSPEGSTASSLDSMNIKALAPINPDGVGVGVVVGVWVGVTEEVGVGVWVGVIEEVGVGVWLGVITGVDVAEGVGVGVAESHPNSKFSMAIVVSWFLYAVFNVPVI